MHKAADRIRNVALVGHRGSGKTSLHEALLFARVSISRLGTRDRAEPPCRTPNPMRRLARCRSPRRCPSFHWRDHRVNLIDTPGRSELRRRALWLLAAYASRPIFVVNAVMGVEVQASRLWQRAAELDLATARVRQHARPRARRLLPHTGLPQDGVRCRTSWRPRFRSASEHEVSGVIDLIDMKAYAYNGSGRDNCSEIPIPERSPAPPPRSTART